MAKKKTEAEWLCEINQYGYENAVLWQALTSVVALVGKKKKAECRAILDDLERKIEG